MRSREAVRPQPLSFAVILDPEMILSQFYKLKEAFPTCSVFSNGLGWESFSRRMARHK